MSSTSLEYAVVAAAVLVAAAAGIWLAGELAKRRAVQLEEQDTIRERFFQSAERLIDDPATSQDVVDWMEKLARVIGSRTILWKFVFHVLFTDHAHGADNAAFKAWQDLPPHLRKDFSSAVVAGMFALTYNNMVLGTLIRRSMLYGVSSKMDGDISSARPAAMMADELAHNGMGAPA